MTCLSDLSVELLSIIVGYFKDDVRSLKALRLASKACAYLITLNGHLFSTIWARLDAAGIQRLRQADTTWVARFAMQLTLRPPNLAWDITQQEYTSILQDPVLCEFENKNRYSSRYYDGKTDEILADIPKEMLPSSEAIAQAYRVYQNTTTSLEDTFTTGQATIALSNLLRQLKFLETLDIGSRLKDWEHYELCPPRSPEYPFVQCEHYSARHRPSSTWCFERCTRASAVFFSTVVSSLDAAGVRLRQLRYSNDDLIPLDTDLVPQPSLNTCFSSLKRLDYHSPTYETQHNLPVPNYSDRVTGCPRLLHGLLTATASTLEHLTIELQPGLLPVLVATDWLSTRLRSFHLGLTIFDPYDFSRWLFKQSHIKDISFSYCFSEHDHGGTWQPVWKAVRDHPNSIHFVHRGSQDDDMEYVEVTTKKEPKQVRISDEVECTNLHTRHREYWVGAYIVGLEDWEERVKEHFGDQYLDYLGEDSFWASADG